MDQRILRNLLWKEWREQQWKLAAVLTIFLSVPAITLLREPEMAFYIVIAGLFYGVPLAAIFLGMGVAAGEREQGTLAHLRSLPVGPRSVLAVKLAVAAAACLLLVLALALAMLATLVWVPLPPLWWESLANAKTWLWLLAQVPGTPLGILLWTVAVGLGQPTQVRSGLCGLAALVAWGAVLWVMAALTIGEPSQPIAVAYTLLVSPFGFVLLVDELRQHEMGGMVWPAAAAIPVQLLIWALLIAWSMRRFARLTPTDHVSLADAPSITVAAHVHVPARRTRLGAVVWMQWRRILPVIGVGLAVVLGFSLLQAISLWQRPDLQPLTLTARLRTVQEVLPVASLGLGMLVAIFAGLGVFGMDAHPRVDRFWRSRPINPDLWFWTKYLTGALVLLLALNGPMLLLYPILGMHQIGIGPRGLAYLACTPLFHLCLYTLAVLLMCVLRQPMYAGLITAMLALVSLALPETAGPLGWFSPVRVIEPVTYWGQDLAELFLPYALSISGAVVLTALLAWQALRRDWHLATA